MPTTQLITSQNVKTLLVVDDDTVLRMAMADTLEMEGYRVIVAENGQAALQILESEKVDLIISDIRMPNGDGLFLLDEVRKKDPSKPCLIFVTGFSEVETDECLKRGANQVLQKPFRQELLISAIKQLLPEC